MNTEYNEKYLISHLYFSRQEKQIKYERISNKTAKIKIKNFYVAESFTDLYAELNFWCCNRTAWSRMFFFSYFLLNLLLRSK